MLNSLGKLVCIGKGNREPDAFFSKNIYICIHPEDKKHFQGFIMDCFAEISDVFCLWTRKNEFVKVSQNEEKQYLKDISKHKVFAVCITEHFITSEICIWELQKATQMKMNILPLFLDDNMAVIKRFNEISSNLHGLHPFSDKQFMESLHRYLYTTTCFDEGLFNKIKEAFSTNVFISYRHIDKEHILPLMDAIHSIDELDAVAIWYDEEEKVGEAFDDQIWNAFEEADLGILLISKNILEKGNYVAEKEYPFICENNKKFISVVIDDADISMVSDFFAKEAQRNNKSVYPITHSIPITDKTKIAETIYSILSESERIKKGKTYSIETSYYLGMAYLTNTLAPQNTKKALRFFKQSAQGGYKEAFEKITTIYESGIGISPDIDKAVKTQEEYVEFLCSINENERDFTYYEDVYSNIMRLINLCEKGFYEGELDYCRSLLLPFVLEQDRKDPNSIWKYRTIEALNRYARSLMNFQEYEDAFKSYRSLAEEFEDLADQLKSKGIAICGGVGFYEETVLKELTDCYREMGRALFFMADKDVESERKSGFMNINNAIKQVQKSIRIKEFYWKEKIGWAINSLHMEYLLLIQILLRAGQYENARSVIDMLDRNLEEIMNSHSAKTEHFVADIKSLIYRGDIFEYLGCFEDQSRANKMVSFKYSQLRENGIEDDELEKMIKIRNIPIDVFEKGCCAILGTKGFLDKNKVVVFRDFPLDFPERNMMINKKLYLIGGVTGQSTECMFDCYLGPDPIDGKLVISSEENDIPELAIRLTLSNNMKAQSILKEGFFVISDVDENSSADVYIPLFYLARLRAVSDMTNLLSEMANDLGNNNSRLNARLKLFTTAICFSIDYVLIEHVDGTPTAVMNTNKESFFSVYTDVWHFKPPLGPGIRPDLRKVEMKSLLALAARKSFGIMFNVDENMRASMIMSAKEVSLVCGLVYEYRNCEVKCLEDLFKEGAI